MFATARGLLPPLVALRHVYGLSYYYGKTDCYLRGLSGRNAEARTGLTVMAPQSRLAAGTVNMPLARKISRFIAAPRAVGIPLCGRANCIPNVIV